MLDEATKKYGKFVARRPLVILVIVAIMSILGIYGLQSMSMESLDNKDMLPENVEVLDVFELLESKFGGTESGNVVIEINNRDVGSEVDIRSPEVLEYVDLLGERLDLIEDVSSVSSITESIKDANGGSIPKTLEGVKSVLQGVDASSYIDSEYTLVLLTMRLSDSYDEAELYDEVVVAIEDMRSSKPGFVDAKPSGSYAISVAAEKLIAPDMSNTTTISLIAILVIVTLLFMSIRYSFISLTAVVFGVIWGLGIISIIGIPITSITSGAISMTLGIGIDFGIQMVTRFRQELRRNDDPLEKVMGRTMAGVAVPMATTTVAALIGFWAMTTGKLSIIGDLATMMAYGVTFSFFAALTVIPVLLILNEKYFGGRK